MSQTAEQLRELVANYNDCVTTATNKERAQMEDAIWVYHQNMVGGGGRITGAKREWLDSILGGGPGQYEYRGSLHNAGSDVDVIWAAVEAGTVSLSAGARVLRDARRLVRKKETTLREAVVQELKNAPSASKPVEQVAVKEPSSSEKTVAQQHAVKFNLAVRNLAAEHIKVTLEDVDIFVRDTLLSDFFTQLDSVLQDFAANIRSHKRQQKGIALSTIGQTRFKQACEVLCIECKFGKRLDMRKARKNYSRLVKDLHPDLGGGNETEQYQAVVNAWRILQDYERQTGKKV